MNQRAIAAVILAAGHGTRMKSATPKVLHEIGGRSMLAHAMATAKELAPQKIAVVIGDHAPGVGAAAKAECADAAVCVQAPPRGTGDAAMKAMSALEGFEGVVLILYADTPLVEAATLAALAGKIGAGATVAVLGFAPDDPAHYGRLKLGADGSLEAIIEAKDASPDELEIGFANSGVMAIEGGFLRRALPQLKDNNAKREYYLTDIVAIARNDGLSCAVLEADEDEVVGVNSRVELAIAEEIFQDRRRFAALEAGVTLIDPSTTYFSFDTEVAADVVIEPNVFFGRGVKVGAGARIRAFSHLEGADIGESASVGPFARLRPGARLGAEAKVGNFVEVKNADIGEDAKVSHLTYIGDASVGAGANIGAGTITCNYDGYSKHRTEIGEGAFIGSNSALVAPVKIGKGAYVGSGSVITKDVEDDALAVARGRQSAIKGWAAKFRSLHAGRKKDKT
ncbi:MAG TPA: bifunctional UDP-N-acetylglucosamine diphosphorylase/glucosamine-1-phosphate N-acetyltransferase GlmU [Parvularculaceae bacterium]|nr:bifunctional UDP-N-acetylglucosamine diphosphorylase/glucosamine-1-phosphate N-acetyltransferase GlmU [Parvularculaceae bacterium]